MPLFRMPLGNAGSGACWLPLGFRWRGGKRGNRAGTLLVPRALVGGGGAGDFPRRIVPGWWVWDRGPGAPRLLGMGGLLRNRSVAALRLPPAFRLQAVDL